MGDYRVENWNRTIHGCSIRGTSQLTRKHVISEIRDNVAEDKRNDVEYPTENSN